MKKLFLLIGYVIVYLVQTPNLQAQANTSIFDQFPWIVTNNLVQQDRCTSEKIAVYASGVYNYLLITDTNGIAKLYNQDGLFYCQNASNYDCVAAYNLGSPIDNWTCGSTTTPPVTTITTCDLLSRITLNNDLCAQCYQNISVYEYLEKAYLVYTAQHNSCIDARVRVVDCETGAGYCLEGGTGGHLGCSDFLVNAKPVETILEADCPKEEGCRENIGTIFFRTCDTGELYYFIETDDRRLFDPYFDSSVSYVPVDGQRVYFEYTAATFASPCSIAEQAISVACIEVAENNPQPNDKCGNYSGVVVLEPCDDGTNFFFIDADYGRKLDPYLAAGIDFTFKAGERVSFDFDPASFYTPCSAAYRAVVLTCIEAEAPKISNNALFDKYSFLPTLVDPNNCQGTSIEEYDQGSHAYLFVRTGPNAGSLYFENGTFYCLSTATYNCITAYNLGQPTATWTCGENNNQQNNDCEVTLTNTQCRRIGVYDEANRLLTVLEPGPFGNAPIGLPIPEWTDPTPLADDEQRTYILKEGNFILTRKIATCESNEITTSNIYSVGCNDGLSIGTYTNTGCRTMTMVNTSSEVLATLAPGESETFTATNYIYIFLVGNDTIDIKSDVGGNIDSGGCGGNGNNCSVTITNTQCRLIGVYDEADRLLTTIDPGPFGNAPFGTPTPQWTDPIPLANDEIRTYTLKEGNFILTRKTVTCENNEITTSNRYAAGCNDGLSLGIYTNIGCKAMTMVNTNGGIIGILTPGESDTLTATNFIYIFLVGNDTIDIKSDVGGDIDSGGCGGNGNNCSITITNIQCRTIGVYDEADSLLTTMAAKYAGAPIPERPDAQWTDPRPLADNETRTYIFKENNLIIGRQRASCADNTINTQSDYLSSCTDALGLEGFRNAGCRELTFFDNSSNRVIFTLAPDEERVIVQSFPIRIWVVLAGNDTVAILNSVASGGFIVPIDTGGGCGNVNSPLFEEYAWLETKINPTTCTEGIVTVYQSGIYKYLFVRTAGVGTLYFQDGTFYCQNSGTLECVTAYNLGDPIDSWECGDDIGGCICPAVVNPVCGVDGITYNNACEAACAGVEIAFNTSCNIDPVEPDCLPIISNTQCKPIGIFDEAGNQLTLMPAASLGEVITEIIPTWTDPTPLSIGASRTYILKDELLVVARKTVTCDQTEITTSNPYNDSCNDGLSIGTFTNTGCRDLTITNTQGIPLATLGPNGTLGPLTVTNEIFILLVESDTFAIKSDEAGAINTGGCGLSPAPNAIPANFTDYDMIYRVCRGTSLTIPLPYRDVQCPTPINCPGICENFPFRQYAAWKGGEVTTTLAAPNIGSTVTFSPTATTVYTGTFEAPRCGNGPAGAAGRAYKYLVIVEDTPNCQTSEQTKFEIEACVGDLITLPLPSHIDICSGIILDNNVGVVLNQEQNFVTLELQAAGTFSSFLGVGSVQTGGNIFIETACPLTTYEYTVRIKSDCEAPMPNNAIFEEYPWLSSKINATNCSNEKVAVYQQGTYQYLLVTDAQGGAVLYNQDGQFYCQNASNYDCVAAYNLGAAIQSWTCNKEDGACAAVYDPVCGVDGSTYGNECEALRAGVAVNYEGECQQVACPAVYEPVCGVDGRTYGNGCEAGVAGVTIAYNGECGNPPSCEDNTGTIFFRNCDNGQQYYFIQTEDGRIFDPYFNDGILYDPIEGQKVNFSFVDADFPSPCSLAEKAINITCIETADNPSNDGDCTKNRGTIFFEKCDDGTSFFFVRTSTGVVLDIYFAEGIDFVKFDGQKVRFDYVAADFATPCSIASQAVIVTCIEEDANNDKIVNDLIPDNFEDFDVIFRLCKGDTLTIPRLSRTFVPICPCPPPSVCGPFGPITQREHWRGTAIQQTSNSVLLYPSVTTTYTVNFPDYRCASTGIGPAGPSGKPGTELLTYLVIVEEDENCTPLSNPEELTFDINACVGDIIRLPAPHPGTCPIGPPITETDVVQMLAYAQNTIDLQVKGEGTVRVANWLGNLADVECPHRTYTYNISCSDNSTSLDPIFSTFDWLMDYVDPSNCNGEIISVYQAGAFQYVYIEAAAGGQLYFQDGTFYCQNSPNYDCVAAYRLATPISTWHCSTVNAPQSEERGRTHFETIDFTPSPNPTTGRFAIQITGNQENKQQLRVMDVIGRILVQEVIEPSVSTLEVDLSAYQNGVYYLELRSKGERMVRKVIKQDLE